MLWYWNAFGRLLGVHQIGINILSVPHYTGSFWFTSMLETKCVDDNSKMLVTVLAIFYMSVGHQHPKDVTNIEILSPISQNGNFSTGWFRSNHQIFNALIYFDDWIPSNPIWFEMPDSIIIFLNLIRLKYRCLICIGLIVIFMIIVTFMRAVTTLVVVISHLVIDFHFLNYEIKHKCILIEHFLKYDSFL